MHAVTDWLATRCCSLRVMPTLAFPFPATLLPFPALARTLLATITDLRGMDATTAFHHLPRLTPFSSSLFFASHLRRVLFCPVLRFEILVHIAVR
jgi:hypothetical protein